VSQELRQRLIPKEASHLLPQMLAPLKKLWISDDEMKRPVRRLHAEEFIGEVRKIATLVG
jgi:hypothetical protein